MYVLYSAELVELVNAESKMHCVSLLYSQHTSMASIPFFECEEEVALLNNTQVYQILLNYYYS